MLRGLGNATPLCHVGNKVRGGSGLPSLAWKLIRNNRCHEHRSEIFLLCLQLLFGDGSRQAGAPGRVSFKCPVCASWSKRSKHCFRSPPHLRARSRAMAAGSFSSKPAGNGASLSASSPGILPEGTLQRLLHPSTAASPAAPRD